MNNPTGGWWLPSTQKLDIIQISDGAQTKPTTTNVRPEEQHEVHPTQPEVSEDPAFNKPQTTDANIAIIGELGLMAMSPKPDNNKSMNEQNVQKKGRQAELTSAVVQKNIEGNSRKT